MFKGEYTLKFKMREDGGVRISSPDIPGLILSGPDPIKFFGSAWEPICDLIRHNVEPENLFDKLAVGDAVRHQTRGPGIVRAIEDGCVKIEFEDHPGKISATFDRAWFRLRGNLLAKK